MIDTGSRSSLVQRMIRAARLDSELYEEVEADQTATRDAAIAVTIVAVAGGIGGAIAAVMNPERGNPVLGLIFGILSALLGWVIWSYITYFIGTRLFQGRATPGEMMRAIGFAQSPGVLNILIFIPLLGPLLGFIVSIWMLVAGVIAVRQALDFDTGKAVITTILGWLALVAISVVLTVLGLGAMFAVGA